MTMTLTKCLHTRWAVGTPPDQTHICMDCGFTKNTTDPYHRASTPAAQPELGGRRSPETIAMRAALLNIAIGETQYVAHDHLRCQQKTCGLSSNAKTMTKNSRGEQVWVIVHRGIHDADATRVK